MRVTVDDVELYVDVDGCALVPDGDRMAARPTLVLLHGGPGADHTLFKPEFGAITDTAQVIYVDQRGSGRSGVSVPEMWTWTRWADDVAGLCRVLGLGRPILVGTSSGGLVAMHCAARHPGLVAGLVLDSTLGVPTTMDETLAVFARRGGPAAYEAAQRYLGGDMTPAATRAWETYALPVYGHDPAPRRQRALLNDDVQTHFRTGGCGPADAAPIAASIVCPALILAGEDDPVCPAVGAGRLAAQLTRAAVDTHVLPGIGHGVFRQAPERSFALVRGFLSDISGPGSVRGAA
jgi:pimeloyl-ACP methyl ester carboxylesterase